MSDQDAGIVPKAAEHAARSPESTLAPDVDPQASAAPADANAPTPDLGRTAEAAVGRRGRLVEVTILTTLAVLYTLYFAREFLVPIAFALLLNFLLSPLIRRMLRWHIKPPVSAAFVVLLLLTAVAEGASQLAGPAQRWAMSAPQSFARAEERLRFRGRGREGRLRGGGAGGGERDRDEKDLLHGGAHVTSVPLCVLCASVVNGSSPRRRRVHRGGRRDRQD